MCAAGEGSLGASLSVGLDVVRGVERKRLPGSPPPFVCCQWVQTKKGRPSPSTSEARPHMANQIVWGILPFRWSYVHQ